MIFVSDLGQWLKHSTTGTYADDTQTSVSGKELQIVKSELESDAVQVMRFMASNGLIANPKKTALVILNKKFDPLNEISMKIGKDVVVQVSSAKLLGITFESNQKWDEHNYGTGGVLSCLNQRLFFIRRLKNSISPAALLKISHGLFISKLRYGLQLLGCVRWKESDPTIQIMEALQKCQNKLLRALNGSRVSDQISTKTLLSKFKILSVNQMNAQTKLCEMWKSVHIENYPIETDTLECHSDAMNTRARYSGLLKESKISNKSQRTFTNDAIHIWNQAPCKIRDSKSLFSAKKAIKEFVALLPI